MGFHRNFSLATDPHYKELQLELGKFNILHSLRMLSCRRVLQTIRVRNNNCVDLYASVNGAKIIRNANKGARKCLSSLKDTFSSLLNIFPSFTADVH